MGESSLNKGTLYIKKKDGPEEYEKLMAFNEIETFESDESSSSDSNKIIATFSDKKSVEFKCCISRKSSLKINNWLWYGWRAKGHLRKKLMFKTCKKYNYPWFFWHYNTPSFERNSFI